VQLINEPIMNTAQNYLNAGLSVLPAIRTEKRPAIGKWKQYQQRLPLHAELNSWPWGDAVCIICGTVSGDLEIIDFDGGGELFPAWMDRIDPDLRDHLVIESTPSGGMHVIYRCDVPVCGNFKLSQRKADDKILTLIETRGEGGLFLCSPTPGYELMQGDLCELPILTESQRDTLLQTAWELNEYWPPVVDGANVSQTMAENSNMCGISSNNSHMCQMSSNNGHSVTDNSHNTLRPGDDFNKRGDVRDLLLTHGWMLAAPGENEYWRRPGKDTGWSATLKDRVFYVFSSNADPFEPNRGYSPFAVYALLEHGGDFTAATKRLAKFGFGDDLEDSSVDLSGILDGDEQDDATSTVPDPGPLPENLLYIPGFIGEVIDFCMANAPYPSLGMAFCGALAMQSYLCGRKVREAGDLRTNIYLLALGSSSAGKNYPRQINAHLAIAANMTDSLCRKFASGEGIEDQLAVQPCTMYQTDEIDGILQSVNKSKDARNESIMTVLLELFSSASMMYSMRSKAGKPRIPGVIHQPHLTVFGTATPTHYYEAMSERMLTNGFFARMIIVDTGKRSPGQEAGLVDTMPGRLVDTARWWGNYQPGEHRGNLIGFYPVPVIVPYSEQAKAIINDFRQSADNEYAQAEDRKDEVAMTVWGRANENARKLALLYACSENHVCPQISVDAVRWASAFVEHQIQRMLYMAYQYVSTNEFDAECKKALRYLIRSKHSGKEDWYPMPDWRLRRHMATSPSTYDNMIEALTKQKRIELQTLEGSTKPRKGWILL
jgi:hypothetical protein